MAATIKLRMHSRPNKEVTRDDRHFEVMQKMAKIGPPLGFSEIELPPAPSCGVELIAVYFVKLPIKGLKLSADYAFRGPKYVYKDLASYDEHMRYEFKISNKAIDYQRILHDDFMKVIAAFGAYRAEVAYDLYGLAYQGGTQDENPVYNKLLQDDSVDVDGRNNIFTLHPAQFWDLELCRRALGYGPEEVIARLKGICRLAIPLLDGVYIVLNDDPEMSYEEYVEMNNTIKPILGLL